MAWTRGYRRRTQEITCKECGTKSQKPITEIKRGGGRFCNVKCAAAYNSKKRDTTGENNPNFKGGISQDTYHYKKIQKERYPDKVRAREKAGYERRKSRQDRACEICGQTGEGIHDHHDDYAKPKETRPLCRRHHDRLHAIIGKGKERNPDRIPEAIETIKKEWAQECEDKERQEKAIVPASLPDQAEKAEG